MLRRHRWFILSPDPRDPTCGLHALTTLSQGTSGWQSHRCEFDNSHCGQGWFLHRTLGSQASRASESLSKSGSISARGKGKEGHRPAPLGRTWPNRFYKLSSAVLPPALRSPGFAGCPTREDAGPFLRRCPLLSWVFPPPPPSPPAQGFAHRSPEPSCPGGISVTHRLEDVCGPCGRRRGCCEGRRQCFCRVSSLGSLLRPQPHLTLSFNEGTEQVTIHLSHCWS